MEVHEIRRWLEGEGIPPLPAGLNQTEVAAAILAPFLRLVGTWDEDLQMRFTHAAVVACRSLGLPRDRQDVEAMTPVVMEVVDRNLDAWEARFQEIIDAAVQEVHRAVTGLTADQAVAVFTALTEALGPIAHHEKGGES